MPTVTVYPTADTHIDSTVPTTPQGSSTSLYLNVGPSTKRRALLRFDLSSIPSYATCTSATLTLTSNVSGQPSIALNVYSLASGVSDWTDTAATWNNYKSGTAWPGSAGALTPGTDYEATLLGSGTVSPSTPATISLSTSRIEDWFGGSSLNYGLLVAAASQYHGVGSVDNVTPAKRPTLEVVYSVPDPDPVAFVTAVSGPSAVVAGSLALTPSAAALATTTAAATVATGSAPPVLVSYLGDAYLETKSRTLTAALLATGGSNWILTDGDGDPAYVGLQIDRLDGSTVPT